MIHCLIWNYGAVDSEGSLVVNKCVKLGLCQASEGCCSSRISAKVYVELKVIN